MSALEPGGRIILARALLGAHPRWDPPTLSPTSLLEVRVAWPDGVLDVQDATRTRHPASAQSARLGSKQTGPLSRTLQQAAPASHTPGLACLYQRPQTLFKYALQAHRARHCPCKSRRSICARCFAALPDFIRLELLSYRSVFCQPKPRPAAVHPHPRCCCFASGSRT
jgi:hypothetical protein